MNIDFQQVRARVGGLKGVITRLGDAPEHDHKWKSFSKCPFCGEKNCAGVFTKGEAEFFKCQHVKCNTGGRVVTEVGYINLRLGLSEEKPEHGPSPAYRHLLELAGCWQEPAAPAAPGADCADEDEELIQQCIEVIRSEQNASVSILQRRLRLGYTRAARIMDELEKRSMVGPSNGADPRKILIAVSSGADRYADEHAALENLPSSDGFPAAAPGGSDGLPATPSPEINVGVYDTGSGDPAPPRSPATPAVKTAAGEFISDGADLSQSPPSAGPVPPPVAVAPGPQFESEPAAPLPSPVPLAAGLASLRAFYARLTPTDSELRPHLDGQPVPDPLPSALVKKLEFKAVTLRERRALTPETCAALGFRANPRANEDLLRALREEFEWEELVASGLWLEADKKKKQDRRPNTQYCGKGQVGRKPEKERRDDKDKTQWGWCEPVLIPYFDALGQLVRLRPHKGGATSGTAAGSERIYVPRDPASKLPERYHTVVICEGEYKACVIWQEAGAGARLNYDDKRGAVGVCALPGISFARNYNYRSELDDWLRAVECRKVIVAFDDEDKSGKPLRQRLDAVKYARYLACDLAKKLHVTGLFLQLPKEWRNAKGKADWDGAAVQLLGKAGSAAPNVK